MSKIKKKQKSVQEIIDEMRDLHDQEVLPEELS